MTNWPMQRFFFSFSPLQTLLFKLIDIEKPFFFIKDLTNIQVTLRHISNQLRGLKKRQRSTSFFSCKKQKNILFFSFND